MSDDAVKIDEMVDAYLAIRGEREKLSRDFELRDAELKADQVQIEQLLLERCNEINAETIRTSAGTVVKTMKENFICNDWDGLKQFILDKGMIELMQQRIHNTNLKEYLTNHPEDGMPPGVSSIREYSVVVRKPSKS